MLNVVIVNGGRGAASLIPALLGRPGVNLTSVVNAYDDGKSTGEIRRFFNMLGPSDIRKVQELMLPKNDPDHAASLHLFRYRYPHGSDRAQVLADLAAFAEGHVDHIVGVTFLSFKIHSAIRRFVREFLHGLGVAEKVRGEALSFDDCSIMNCLYAGAHLVFNRNFEDATRYIDRLFRLKGTVLPTSIEDKKLLALRENGEMLYCEAEIVELRSNVRIERIYLLDSWLDRARFEPLTVHEKREYLERNQSCVEVSEGVRRALQQADIIVYSAGTQHSSLYPTYLSKGLASAIADNKKAYKVFVTNIGADYETPSYRASDYVRGAWRYLNLSDQRRYGYDELFDVILVNRPSGNGDSHVELDEHGFHDIDVERVIDSYETGEGNGKHDGEKVVADIMRFYEVATTIA